MENKNPKVECFDPNLPDYVPKLKKFSEDEKLKFQSKCLATPPLGHPRTELIIKYDHTVY